LETRSRVTLLDNKFVELYHKKPVIWARAPGRVDLMGSHTDYNQGYVLTQAIDRETWIAGYPRENERVVIHSLNLPGSADFDLREEITFDQQTTWTNYVRGVAEIFRQQGYILRGFDGLIHSTVPVGSGLSSSAALEVACAVLFNQISDLSIDPLTIALLCQRAENKFVGMNCGILDQYTSMMGESGGVLLLDCRDISSTTRKIADGIQIVICDTQAKRELTGSEYPERRAQCEEGARFFASQHPDINALRDVTLELFTEHSAELNPVVAKRCRFVIEENQRVLDMAEAISTGDRHEISTLSSDSYTGARDLYEIGSPEMEEMMVAMLNGPGVIGARQAGAGFGGCMVAFVEDQCLEAFTAHVSEKYQVSTGIDPRVYPVQAAPGASILED
jgi:galactokinase